MAELAAYLLLRTMLTVGEELAHTDIFIMHNHVLFHPPLENKSFVTSFTSKSLFLSMFVNQMFFKIRILHKFFLTFFAFRNMH